MQGERYAVVDPAMQPQAAAMGYFEARAAARATGLGIVAQYEVAPVTTARFVPWVRPTSWDGNAVIVRVAGQDVPVPFSRYGPGDVSGIAPQQVRRRDPAPGSRSMPPNLFPSIEFATPSLPWMVTPGEPDGLGMLRPWLALIVLPGGPDRLGAVAGALAPVVDVPADQLPPHDQLALWAHVQLDADNTAEAALATGIARIVAPYALRPTTDYVACLVPTFEAGRLAGLGETVADPLQRRHRHGAPAAATSACPCSTRGRSPPPSAATSRRWPGG